MAYWVPVTSSSATLKPRHSSVLHHRLYLGNKSALSFFCHTKVNGTQKSLGQQSIKGWLLNSSLSPHLVWEEHSPETAPWHLSSVLCIWFSQLLSAFFNPSIKTETNSFKFSLAACTGSAATLQNFLLLFPSSYFALKESWQPKSSPGKEPVLHQLPSGLL